MPERSKGFDLRSNVFALVGSNPTLDTENDLFSPPRWCSLGNGMFNSITAKKNKKRGPIAQLEVARSC